MITLIGVAITGIFSAGIWLAKAIWNGQKKRYGVK